METTHEPPPPSALSRMRVAVEHMQNKLRSEKARIAFFFVLCWSSLIVSLITIIVWSLMLSSLSTRSAFYGIIHPHLDLPTGLPYYKYSWLIEETDTANEAIVSLVPLPKSAYTAASPLRGWDYMAVKPEVRGTSFGLFKQATGAHLSATVVEGTPEQLAFCTGDTGVSSSRRSTDRSALQPYGASAAKAAVRLKFESIALDVNYLNFKLVLSKAKMATMKINAFTTYIRVGDEKAAYEPNAEQIALLQQMVDTIEDKVVNPSPNVGSCTVMPQSLDSTPPPSVIPHPNDCPWDNQA